MTQLYHFYHIWVDGEIDLCKNIISDHIHALKISGLYDELITLYIGIVGKDENRELIKQFFTDLNIEYTLIIEAKTGYEQVTQNKLYEFSLLNDGYVLYAHNKGAYSATALNADWRKSMTYFNIIKWKEAIKHLDTVDAVGCHWLSKKEYPRCVNIPFFGGTFWWSNLSFIRNLGYPGNNSRFDAENWLGTDQNIKIYDLLPGWPDGSNFFTSW